VKLTRGTDEWFVQVGDITTEPITDAEAQKVALEQANGTREDFLDHDNGGWVVEGTYPDEQFHELYGVTNEQLQEG